MGSEFIKYITSNWAIFVNTPIFIIFGLVTYNAYAKRWSAKSGKYSTKGHITWSGKIPGGKPPYLVSYSYYVDGTLYNGQINVSLIAPEKTIEKNPKGKELTIYYAKKDPSFSQANKPPNHAQIIGNSVITHLFLPLGLINIIFTFIYRLAHVNN